jgi:SAM-dependent methyltransferase
MRSLLAASVILLARTLDRGITMCSFAAAGVLRFEALGRHTGENWHHYGRTQAEADVAIGLYHWERDFYARFLGTGQRVLVAGCGTGRDLLPLLEQGLRAEGLEAVAACAEEARRRLVRRGFTAPVLTGDIATATLSGRYDVVIFSWYCYSYIPLRARRVATLARLAEHLAADGRVLISYVLTERPPRRLPWRLARLVSQLSRSDWRPEYGDVFSARPDTRRLHYEHQFRPDEIEDEARTAGFDVAFHEQGSDGLLALRPAR